MCSLENDRLADVREDLIFDLGMHHGEDTACYLALGFRVVAIEADPQLCEKARRRFAAEIEQGRLHIENRAIARTGRVTFYPNKKIDLWGTISRDWVERNCSLGTLPEEGREVQGINLTELMLLYGCPAYLKIDIEGADRIALASLFASPFRPHYISIESEKVKWRLLKWEIATLGQMGYGRFKAVPQHKVNNRRSVLHRTDGTAVNYQFPRVESSGPFGNDAPGKWVGRRHLLWRYRAIFLRYIMFGDRAMVGPGWRRWLAVALIGLFGKAGWWDTHAAYGGHD